MRSPHVCLYCGKAFNVPNSELRRERGKYCSRKCVLEHKAPTSPQYRPAFMLRIERDQLARIKQLATQYRISVAEATRMVIAWGLDTLA